MSELKDYIFLTKVTQQDLDEGVWDAEHKGLYSKDGRRFLKYVRPRSIERGNPDTFQLKSGVEVICEKAFSEYYSPLTSFVIPNSVVAIGDGAFEQMKLPQYGKITITKGLKYIGHNIFGNTHGILDVVFEEGITDIDLANVLNFPAALTVYLPSTLKSIGKGGFGGMEVSHIFLAEGNKHFCVENGVLYDYAKTTLLRCPVTKRGKYEIPEGVTTIAPHALQLCGWPDAIGAEPEPKLSVTLPNSLTTIKKSSFRASWLESIYIPSTVSVIEECSFEWPVNLAIEIAPDNARYEVKNSLLIDKTEKKVLYGFSNNIDIPTDVKSIADYALGHLQPTSLIIPEGVTSIGKWNINLNSILHLCIPSTLKHISRESFWGSNFNYSERPTIIVQPGMADIIKDKIYDFYGDYDIRSYIKEIPKNLIISDDGKTVLGVYDESILSVEIPFGIEIIAENAFCGAGLLREVFLPQSVRVIEASAFQECKYLSQINLSEGLKEIGDWAFFCCPFLKSVVIPSSVEKIGDFAFSDCSSLEEVVLYEGLCSIGDGAFDNCSSLKKIEFPGSLQDVDLSNFDNCKSLKEIVFNEGIKALEGVFLHHFRFVKRLEFPNSLENVSGLSFCGFTNLKEIRLLPENPYFKFVDGALYSIDLKRLIKVMPTNKGTFMVPQSVREIDSMAFQDCKILTKIVVPDSVTKIGRNAFERCSSLIEISLPKKIKRIEELTFMDCKELREIEIPSGIRVIDRWAFWHCNSLKELKLPESLATIGVNAFPYNLQNISIDNKNKRYRVIDGVMYNQDMTELVLIATPSKTRQFIVPDSIKKIRKYAFMNCNKLESIKLPDGLIEIGASSFRGCESLQSITLPDGIKEIPEGAFGDCSALNEVNFPKELQIIGDWAFCLCVCLQSLTIPESVRRLEERSLPIVAKEIHVSYTNPSEAAKVFRKVRKSESYKDYRFKLYVPKGTKTNYKKEKLFTNWVKIKEDID